MSQQYKEHPINLIEIVDKIGHLESELIEVEEKLNPMLDKAELGPPTHWEMRKMQRLMDEQEEAEWELLETYRQYFAAMVESN